nr:MAG TPA: hypothetical protein [Caudoviricetes sp.]
MAFLRCVCILSAKIFCVRRPEIRSAVSNVF